ncbi:formyl transferase [Geranomyces variabilis]|nr:formyl transferase [Geranomyces variabilis]KAJ3135130.1 hypothetical protein HDU90_004162 [Geranomyces variabilis]
MLITRRRCSELRCLDRSLVQFTRLARLSIPPPVLCRRAFHTQQPPRLLRPHSVLFFGSDEFSILCLKRLHNAQLSRPNQVISHLEVVTPPDNPRNKVSQVPLKLFAASVGLKVHSAPPKSLRGWNIPESSNPFTLAVVVSFGYFLPRRVIASFPHGALNVHPSLLPKYRGAAPLQHTILNDDREGGVSIIELDDKRFDVGRILKQTRIDIPPKTRFSTLHDQLGAIGAADLLTVIADLPSYKAQAQLQDESAASSAPKISKTMAVVDWTRTAREIATLDRAIGEKIPLHTTFRGRRIQLLTILDPDESGVPPSTTSAATPKPGSFEIDASAGLLRVACGSGTWLSVQVVKVEGKNAVRIPDFVNGYQLKSGTGQNSFGS